MTLSIPKRTAWRFLEKALIIFTLFIMVRPLVQYTVIGGVDIQVLITLLMYICMGVIIFLKLERFTYILLLDKLLLVLISLPMLSILWTANLSDSLTGVAIFIGATLLGVYMAMRFSIREQVAILGWVIALIAISSAILGLFFPSIGRGTAAGQIGVWTGVFVQKNGLGRYMALGALVFWLLQHYARPKWLMWLGFGLCFALMILARSATSLVALILVIGSQPLYRAFKARRLEVRIFLFVLSAVVSLAIVIFFLQEPARFFELLGRDPERNTVYVRLSIWNELWPFMVDQPILGYGFDGFWGDGRTLYGWTPVGWTTGHAHNGFIEIVLQLGIVGLIPMIIHLIINFRRSFQMAESAELIEGLWSFNYLFLLLVLNMSYSMVLGQLTVPWVLYVSLTLTMCLKHRQIKFAQKQIRDIETRDLSPQTAAGVSA